MTSRDNRVETIAAQVQAKKQGQPGPAAPRPGSVQARRTEATAPGPVAPSKPAGTKIPSGLNLTRPKRPEEPRPAEPRVDDTSTATEGDIRKRADAELDASVAKPAKKEVDKDMMTVGDVAREIGVDPKRARARLRALDKAAVEGRWPKVRRGSPEHEQLKVDIAEPADAK